MFQLQTVEPESLSLPVLKVSMGGAVILDDLDMTNVKYIQLIARLRDQFRAAKERPGKDRSNQKSDDFLISKEIPHAHEETV